MDRPEKSLDRTHVLSPDGEWALWRPFVLRAPGFPASGVSRLTSPAAAALADKLTENGADSETARAGYKDAFAAEMIRLTGELRAIALSPAFQSAMTWQNHHAVHSGLAPFLRRRPEVDGRNGKYRTHELMLAKYWQRYCVKNDTIGFFGPIGWGRFDPARPHSDPRVGPGLVAQSEVYFETWAVDRLAAKVDTAGQVRRWLAPRIPPFVQIDGRQAMLPGVRPMPLTTAELVVLRCCDGSTPAWRIATATAGGGDDTPSSADEVYSVLDRLVRRRLLVWKLELPMSLRPERDLRRVLAVIGDEAVTGPALAELDRLEAARETVRLAADQPADLEKALDELDATFHLITGASPNRNAGKAYGGRTLVYLDALRDADPVIGRDVLDALQPIGLLLRSIRWLTFQVGERLRAALGRLVDRYVAENGRPPTLAWLWTHAMPLIHGEEGGLVDEVSDELYRRWEVVLECPPDASRVDRTSTGLAQRLTAQFAAPRPGWPAARYSSPDVMISAPDGDALRRGEFELVLGEFHVAINSLRSLALVDRHPHPEDLYDCLRAENRAPRLHPVLAKDSSGRLSVRTHPGLIRDDDFLVALFDQTADPTRPRMLHAASLMVEQAGDQLYVAEPTGHRFDVLEAFAEMLMNVVIDRFGILPRRPHAPRVTIDKLVVARESWRFDPGQIAFAAEPDEALRFARARRWRSESHLPGRVFVSVSASQKPIYLDFDSPLYVNVVAKAIRVRATAGRPDEDWVRMTEVVPALDRLWLTDREGSRFTSELRLALVDLAGL
jgi:Lantibiotic dehydratase, N terminus